VSHHVLADGFPDREVTVGILDTADGTRVEVDPLIERYLVEQIAEVQGLDTSAQ
jgi:hypothetical protein